MKNWKDLSDNEIDQLFRQAAENSLVDFDEKAWTAMEGVLDQKQPRKKPSYLKKYMPILLVLLFMGGAGYYFRENIFGNNMNTISKNNTILEETELNKTNLNKIENTVKDKNIQDNTITETAENKELSNKLEQTKTKENEPNNNKSNAKIEEPINEKEAIIVPNINLNKKPTIEKTNDKSNLKNKTISKPNGLVVKQDNFIQENGNSLSIKKNQNFDKKKKSKNNAFSINNGSELVNNLNTKTENENASIPAIQNEVIFTNRKAENNLISNEKTTKNSLQIADNQLNKENNNDVILPNNNQYSEVIIKNDLQIILLSFLIGKQIFQYQKPNFNQEIAELKLPLKQPKFDPFFRKGFSIRLAYSPDISRVGTNKIEKIGSNYGALLEYRFNKRLVLQTGIIRSIKYYDAYPEQYKWIWGKPPVKLVEVAAKCKMLDYPINIRYDFVANSKTRIFGNLGLTTYKMLKETYDYDYEDNTNPKIKWRQWNGKTGTYYTSNLNISIGFEKQIAKALTLQVEPFAKAPLKDIGFGNVPLVTYGLMFSGNVPLNSIFKK
jgi:hypothetical protein